MGLGEMVELICAEDEGNVEKYYQNELPTHL